MHPILCFMGENMRVQMRMAEKGKGRRSGRVEMRRIENPMRRQITFSKRKAGVLKKAAELSLLCDVDVGLVISSPSGKLYHSPAPNIDRALQRYQKIFASSAHFPHNAKDSENIELLQLELEKGRKIETDMERIEKHMNGEDLDCLSFKELQHLEQRMKSGATKIRSKKERLLRSSKSKLKMREASDMEGGGIDTRVDEHEEPHERDGDANGVGDLQCHTNLSLSLF